MGFFTIDFQLSAEKELRKLPPTIIKRVAAMIEELADVPFPSNTVKLRGEEEAYRVRVGDYRVVYIVDLLSKHHYSKDSTPKRCL